MDTDDPHVRKLQKELNAGTMALVLLAILARADAPLYGYQIAKQLERADPGLAGGKQSAIYPVLRNMSAAGLLESWVEPSVAGPPRRYYRITAEGRDTLQAWTKAWRATTGFVNNVLGAEQ